MGQVESPVIQPLLVQVNQGHLIIGIRLVKYYYKGVFHYHFYPSTLFKSDATNEYRDRKL